MAPADSHPDARRGGTRLCAGVRRTWRRTARTAGLVEPVFSAAEAAVTLRWSVEHAAAGAPAGSGARQRALARDASRRARPGARAFPALADPAARSAARAAQPLAERRRA